MLIINHTGELQQTLAKHQGPVFAAQWSPQGDSIASGSADMRTIVWDAASGQIRREWRTHDGACCHDALIQQQLDGLAQPL